MKEEDAILQKVGKEKVFRTPDGYLENLTSNLMSQLPDKEFKAQPAKKASRWGRLRPALYGVAAVAVIVLAIRIFSSVQQDTYEQVPLKESADVEVGSDRYISTAMENSMLDDYSLYVYLTDSE